MLVELRPHAAADLGQILLGGVGAIILMLLTAQVTERRERRRELWRRDAELCGELEQLAGVLVDRLRDHGISPEEYDQLGAKIGELARLSGRFPRFPTIQAAIRDLHNTASRIWADGNRYQTQQERQEVMAALGARQSAVLAACDSAVGSRPKRKFQR